MWLCMNGGFLSIVTNHEGADLLLVRARCKGHIESLFPDAKVSRTPGKDYLYRASISRDVVAAAVAKSITQISYPNFKNSVQDDDLHDAYSQVWRAMLRLQAVRKRCDDKELGRIIEKEKQHDRP